MNKHNFIYIILLGLNLQVMGLEIELAPQEIPDSKLYSQINIDDANKILIGTGLVLTGISLVLKRPDLRGYLWVTRRHFDESIKNIESKLDEQNQMLQIIEYKLDLLAKFVHLRFNHVQEDNQKILDKIDSQQALTKLESQQVKDYLVGMDQKIDLLLNSLANIKLEQKSVDQRSSINFFKDY
jgi:hypothetical protein